MRDQLRDFKLDTVLQLEQDACWEIKEESCMGWRLILMQMEIV